MKRLVSAVLFIVVVSGMMVIPIGLGEENTAAATDVLYGDVNDDGEVTVEDAVLVLRDVVGLESLGLSARRRADVSYNRRIDVGDAVLILKFVARNINYFPVEAVILEKVDIIGESEVELEQAQHWAASRGAHQRFIDIAPVYWEYGEKTGIRPDVLYAQSAKETAFGNYGGVVEPDFNNWAGIKTRDGGPCDDPDAHQKFDTPEDGVRGHFNHMSAYVGKDPIGEPHGRYSVVASLEWAGSIRYVEELGGRWAPNPEYGDSVVNHYLEPMVNYRVR